MTDAAEDDLDDEDRIELIERGMDRYFKKHPQMLQGAVSNSITSWLDAQYKAVGKWTLRGLLAMLLAALFWWIAHGGKP